MNTMLLWILSSTTQQALLSIPGLLVLAIEFLICFVFDTRLRLKDQKYHFYGASILFFPITAFAIVWVIAGFLIGMPILPTLLIFLLIGFSVNAFLFFTLDIYESKTIILTYAMMVKVLRTLMSSLVSMLRAGIRRFQEQRKLEHINSGLRQGFNKDITLRKADNKMDNFLRPKSRISGDNSLGYDKDGYNKRGYNRDGYDRKG
jgi:c-di-AMP phosphodiesterase-like protein